MELFTPSLFIVLRQVKKGKNSHKREIGGFTMILETKRLEIEHEGQIVQSVYEVKFKEYEDLLIDATNLAKKVRANAPNGKVRALKDITVKCIGGVLAEAAVISCLNKYFEEKSVGLKAMATEFNKGDNDQIDVLIVDENNNQKTVEVRSSFNLTANDSLVYADPKRSYSLIGSYTTANKGRELQKDYYVTVLHRKIWVDIPGYKYEDHKFHENRMNYLKYRIENRLPLTLHISGSVSKEELNEIGTTSSLGQNGAMYKIIKPICKANNIFATADDIIDTFKDLADNNVVNM